MALPSMKYPLYGFIIMASVEFVLAASIKMWVSSSTRGYKAARFHRRTDLNNDNLDSDSLQVLQRATIETTRRLFGTDCGALTNELGHYYPPRQLGRMSATTLRERPPASPFDELIESFVLEGGVHWIL